MVIMLSTIIAAIDCLNFVWLSTEVNITLTRNLS